MVSSFILFPNKDSQHTRTTGKWASICTFVSGVFTIATCKWCRPSSRRRHWPVSIPPSSNYVFLFVLSLLISSGRTNCEGLSTQWAPAQISARTSFLCNCPSYSTSKSVGPKPLQLQYLIPQSANPCASALRRTREKTQGGQSSQAHSQSVRVTNSFLWRGRSGSGSSAQYGKHVREHLQPVAFSCG